MKGGSFSLSLQIFRAEDEGAHTGRLEVVLCKSTHMYLDLHFAWSYGVWLGGIANRVELLYISPDLHSYIKHQTHAIHPMAISLPIHANPSFSRYHSS